MPTPLPVAVVAQCLLALVLQPAALASNEHALRVVPPEMDVSQVVEQIEADALPVDVLVIDVCRAGLTLFEPPPDGLFIAREGFEDGQRLARWVDEAHAAGMRVYAGMDVLRWWDPNSDDPDPFEAHPELRELDSNLSCDPGSTGAYASPWSSTVRTVLAGLLVKLATDYPQLDGLYVDCRLPMSSYLGFSDAARVACIREMGVDPIDIPVYGVRDDDHPSLKPYWHWRMRSVGEFLGMLRAAFREASGGRPLIARATVGVAAWGLRHRAASCQEWMDWRFNGIVDDLVLEIDLARVSRGANAPIDEFNAGYRLYSTIQPPGNPYLLVPGEVRGEPVLLAESVRQMDGWELPNLPLFIDPDRASELEVALEVLSVVRDNRG